MRIVPRKFLGVAFATLLATGCGTGPPGAGVTNGPPPGLLEGAEKPSVRSDLPTPNATGGDAVLAEGAATVPPTGETGSAKASAPSSGSSAGKSTANPDKPSGDGSEAPK